MTGIGVVSAFGTTHHGFRDALLEGRSGIAPLTAFDVSDRRTTLAAGVQAFQPTDWLPPMKLRRLDRTGVYAVAATTLACRDAGVSLPADGSDAVGVVFGTSTAGGGSTQTFLEALFTRGVLATPAMLFDSTVANSAASVAALEHKLRGPNLTMAHKEASGLAAIVTGVDLLREGAASAMVAGGVDALNETSFKGHDRFGVMSAERAFGRSLAPFDVAAGGFVMGEGAFALWLEPGGAAPPRHGEVLGVAAAGAAVPINMWPNDPEPLARTMREALADAGAAPAEIGAVYASAAAAPGLDATEAQALARVFAPPRQPIVTSVKGALGESGASGSAACAAAFVCGAAGRVPPIAGLVEPCPDAAGLRLARQAEAMDRPLVLVNSFASGGALFSAVLRIA